MRRNIGEVTCAGFLVSLCLCLLFGFLIYGRFNFAQKKTVADANADRLAELERRLATAESKADANSKRITELERRLAMTEAKAGALADRLTQSEGKNRAGSTRLDGMKKQP